LAESGSGTFRDGLFAERDRAMVAENIRFGRLAEI